MLMTPNVRKLALVSHVVASVAWLGAVAAFLALSIAGVRSEDANLVRGAYVAMNVIGGIIIVPLSLAALVTGLIQALGTQWGLVRYYWVLVKLALTIGATLLLLLHQFTAVAAAARRVVGSAAGARPELGGLGPQLVADASLAIVVLLATTTLSVYKPWGRTPFERPQAAEIGVRPDPVLAPLGVKLVLVLLGAIVVAAVVSHLAGGGFAHHRM